MDASQFEQLVNVGLAGFAAVLFALGYLGGLASA
jgi:hypothetical protein